MEVGVRLVGVLLRILNFLLAPLFWLRYRRRDKIPPIKDPLLLKSATELVEALRRCELTSEIIVSTYIERIKEVNPYINAVVEDRYSSALDDARAVDRSIEEANKIGALDELFNNKPLLGLPFTVKESCSLGGLSNAVGCLENAGRKAIKDGEAVRLIRQAGAIPLLVSNTPEMCLGWETTNLLRGTTNNPYNLNRTCGGSSGGEAALLAAGASPLSVASDIAGSIRLPAAFCGVFGHKPTPGLVPIAGHEPTLRDPGYGRFLAVGPMARAARDLRLWLRAAAPALTLPPVALHTLNVYYMTEATKSIALIGVDGAIVDVIKSAAAYLHKECGATIMNEKFKDLEDSVEISIAGFFTMKDIPNLLKDPADPKRDKSLLLEFIKYMFGGGSRSLQGLSFALINRTRLFIPDSRTAHYNNKANQLREQMERALGADGVLLYPVCAAAAHYHQQVFTKASGVAYTMVFNVLGMPATAVPAGLWRGLPLSIQVVAAPGQDRLCLAVAEALEAGFGGWRPPC